MQAITVKYLNPTDSKPARLKATCEGHGSITISFPYGLSGMNAYAEAANALCQKLMWRGPLIGGWTGRGSAAFLNTYTAYQVTA